MRLRLQDHPEHTRGANTPFPIYPPKLFAQKSKLFAQKSTGVRPTSKQEEEKKRLSHLHAVCVSLERHLFFRRRP